MWQLDMTQEWNHGKVYGAHRGLKKQIVDLIKPLVHFKVESKIQRGQQNSSVHQIFYVSHWQAQDQQHRHVSTSVFLSIFGQCFLGLAPLLVFFVHFRECLFFPHWPF